MIKSEVSFPRPEKTLEEIQAEFAWSDMSLAVAEGLDPETGKYTFAALVLGIDEPPSPDQEQLFNTNEGVNIIDLQDHELHRTASTDYEARKLALQAYQATQEIPH